ncbi:recombination mediator RecR [Leadbettera azotonutricia]|uniref:Recombination protein RecR n=1 Tax=Leadbettera azotonutricia (strain ATCC BAA-888 / DSM 13862 / ZAS-9) TaxID=545695 RepID=F5YC10_LEAAZ|nr:recombination mediator RecR [Leadbettera azotonutricia]AEF83296.1 recombination protein RecR [Leadbettera azotonutricia ZAS-9]
MTPGNALDRLTALLSRLPGIGKKTAGRLAYHILDTDPAYAHSLASELDNLHDAIKRCSRCGAYTESDPCPICSDPSRDRALLCVVERAQDLRVIEESREYRGLFHVLGGLIAPLEGVGPGDLSIGKLASRIQEEGTRELILALNPTIEGDTTALYLQQFLKEKLKGSPLEITRLASGLPVGGDLEYADRLTLSRSFRGRIKL